MSGFPVFLQLCRGCGLTAKNGPINYLAKRSFLNDVAHEIARLTPSQVSQILRKREASQILANHPIIRRVEVNQLPANNPVEDSYNAAILPETNDAIVGVFDGHGGPACGQTVSNRLFPYIAAELLSKGDLEHSIYSLETTETIKNLISPLSDLMTSVQRQQADAHISFSDFLFKNSLELYINDLNYGEGYTGDLPLALEQAFMRLDADIQREPLRNNWLVDALSAAFSGSTACLAYIEADKRKPRIHVANVGDSRAVIGRRNAKTGQWEAIPLSREHNSENLDEVRRIFSEHPSKERRTVIRDGRLLGSLAPFRAFGDVHFKWPGETLQKLYEYQRSQKSSSHVNNYSLYRLKNYVTPPYLTAQPEIITHEIRKNEDAFLMLASDGLWEWLDAEKAVQFVGEHSMSSEVTDEFEPPPNITLKRLHSLLVKRAEAIKNRHQDSNSATHLIRAALGWSLSAGGIIRHIKLSNILSVYGNPRQYRDDITVLILFFKMDQD